MHIWYQLALREEATFSQAIEKITELHRYALTVGFLGAYDMPAVGELRVGDGSETHSPSFHVTRKLGAGREQFISVPAIEWVGFTTMPGLGTESAAFGLARYPKTYRLPPGKPNIWHASTRTFDGSVQPDLAPIAEPADEIVVETAGWQSWSGFCKTQYAHRHGLDHFMHCHLALIKLLDYANELGILHHVNDDGQYWKTRSADVLVANLRENDRMVAAVVGAIDDQIGGALEDAGYVSVAPIKGAPDFEHLEAEGREKLGQGGVPSSSLGDGIVSSLRRTDALPGAPVLAWPAIDFDGRWPPLTEVIGAMQLLNPELALKIVHDQHGISYLGHGKTSRDLFTIVMPFRVPDKLTTALTQCNEHRRRVKLNNEWTYIDATRIERTATGSLLIRPCTSSVRRARFGIGRALAVHFGDEFVDKAYPGWCLLPQPDGEEFFEFEWSYWPDGIDATAAMRPDGTYRTDREFWSVLPSGFIGIRDEHDISRDAFETRCRTAIEMGVPWCVMIDQEAGDLSVLRTGGPERVALVEDWQLLELPELKWNNSWLHSNTG